MHDSNKGKKQDYVMADERKQFYSRVIKDQKQASEHSNQ